MSGFKITSHHGFHIVFANGVTVSVQFGPCNYCEHYNDHIGIDTSFPWLSANAEVAAWDTNGRWITRELLPDRDDDVAGWLSSEQLLALMNAASRYQEEPCTNTS